MLKTAGYDTILNKSQTYTVWAPVNKALTTIDLKDTATVIEIVKNHIARFSHTTSGLSSQRITVLANKIIVFAGNGTNYTFGGMNINKSNIATSNGIIHYLDNYVPYLPNIWDFIGRTKDLDSLKTYLYSNTKLTFDLAASGNDIGTNAKGQLLYDSVFTFTNKILNKLGALNVEDSLYTAILPNNTAWTEAYNRIKTSFNALPTDGGALKQRTNTQWAIVQDLIFRKQVIAPTSFDSLVSTSGNVFHQPSYLFDGVSTPASNGLVYVSNLMNYKGADSWQKEIRVEAESQVFTDATSFQSFDFTARTSNNPILNLSKNGYLYCKNLSTNNLIFPFAKFNIPGTLSAKYNIYCVFVPTNVNAVDSTDKRPSKVRFYLSYVKGTGTADQIKDAPIDATNKVVIGGTPAVFITNPTTKTKMFVTQFTFPYTNLLDEDNRLTYAVSVKLKVESVAKTTDKTTYNRDFRIDCIILEPVQ
jgi:hypothetical protein